MSTRKYLYKLAGCGLLALVCTTILAQPVSNKPTTQTQAPAPTQSVATVPSAYTAGIKVNYVRTRTAIGPFSTLSEFDTAGYTAVSEVTQYVDGLGRPLQTVNRQQSPTGKDLVTPFIYDAFGRQPIQYLPYVQTDSNSNNGLLKLNPFANQASFYQNATLNPGFAGEQVFYSKTVFENSPLSRVQKALAPGNSWAGSDRGVVQKYLVNSSLDSIRIWQIDFDTLTYGIGDININIPYTDTMYRPGELYKNVTIDEHGNAMVEYKSKEGLVLLKKVQVGTIDSSYNGYVGFLCIYYIYDDLNQLRFVIQPKGVVQLLTTNWQFSATVINELCFRYEYDDRNRMIAKKVPGAGWVYMVYDTRDRLVFTQDANMRNRQHWYTTLYDELNRPVMTGMITYNGNRNDLQTHVTGITGSINIDSIEVQNKASLNLFVNHRQEGLELYKARNSVSFSSEFNSESEASFEAIIDSAAINNTENIYVSGSGFPKT